MSSVLATPSGVSRQSPQNPWINPRVVIGVVALLTSVLGFGWTLGGYFVGDDFGYVGRFFDYPLADWPHLFRASWAGEMWGFQLRELRPITALSFIIDARIWGGNASGFRVTNLLLHAGCAAIVGLLAWRASGRALGCGLAAAVLFALHPAHAEPVQWITGRVDVLTTFFYLAGFGAFLGYRERGGKGWLAAFGALYAAAMFSKEFGLTLPLMCLLADWLWPWGGRSGRSWGMVMPYAVAGALAVIYYFCRSSAFGPGGIGAGMPDLGSEAFYVQLAQRQLTYIGHLFPPANRWLYEGAPWLTDRPIVVLAAIVALSTAAFVAWFWRARVQSGAPRRAILFFGFGWYAMATLPLVVTYISARHLYLASAGVCIVFALILHALLLRRWAMLGVAAVIALLFVDPLRLTMRPWHEAAVMSGEFTAELRRLEPELQAGGALLLDVPEIRQGAYVWTWAVPFVLRPPFVRERWDDRLVVLESRGLYVDWERWHLQPAVTELAAVSTPSWILQASEGVPVNRIPIALERLRPAAERFAAAPLTTLPHESWRQLVNDLTGP